MKIQEDQEKLVRASYDEWRKHPTTAQFLSNLKKHREGFMKTLIRNSKNYTIPDADFRLNSYAMSTVDAIVEAASTYEAFKMLLEHD